MRIVAGFLLVARGALRRLLLDKRALALLFLAAFPVLYAHLTVAARPDARLNHVFEGLLWILFQTVLPITALVAGVAVLGDEIEGRTITYLYTRPLPRPVFYLGRLAGHFGACALLLLLSLLFLLERFSAAVAFSAAEAASLAGIMLLGLAVYTAFFSLLRVFFKRALFIGFILTFIFEVWVSKMPVSGFAGVSVWHHVALLTVRLLEPRGEPLRIPESIGPEELTADSLRTLLIVLIVSLVVGAWFARSREIRLPAAVAS